MKLGQMRIFVFATVIVLGLAIAFLGSLQLAQLLLPDVSFRVGNNVVNEYLRIDHEPFTLTVETSAPDPHNNATLYLFGLPIETASLDSHTVILGPALLTAGRNEIRVRVSRELGPFSVSQWHSMTIFADENDGVLSLELPKKVWNRNVRIAGRAPAGSNIGYTLQRKIINAQNSSVTVGAPSEYIYIPTIEGAFESVINLPDPGAYEVTARAEFGDPDTPIAIVTKSVTFEPKLPRILERSLVVTLNPDDVSVQTRALLVSHDPRLAAVYREDVSERVFLQAIQGDILFDNTVYSSVIRGPIKISAKDGLSEVLQTTRRVPPSVYKDGVFEISRWGGELGNPVVDTIEVRLNGINAIGFSPPPSFADGEKIIWSGSNGLVPKQVSVRIQQPKSVLQPWSISPRDLLPSPISGLVYNLIALAPLLWFLQILKRSENDQVVAKMMRRSILVLGVFVCFSTMTYIPVVLGRAVFSDIANLIANLNNFPRLLFSSELALLFGYFLTLILFLVWHLANPKKGLLAVGNDIRKILLLAFLLGAGFGVAQILVRHARSDGGMIEGLLPNTLWLASFGVCLFIGTWISKLIFDTGRDAAGWRYRINAPAAAGSLVVLAIFVWPSVISFDPLLERFASPIYHALFSILNFISRIGSIAPLIGALLICAYLVDFRRQLDQEDSTAIATILFSGVLVGVGNIWAVFPISFLLGIFIFPRLVLIGKERANFLNTFRQEIVAHRLDYLARELANARQFAASSGWFGLGLFGIRQDDRKKKHEYTPLVAKASDGTELNVTELAFAFGPERTNIHNAFAALRIGIWGVVPFVVIYALPSFATVSDNDFFPRFAVLSRAISVGGYWLIGTFLFGYFYDRLIGATGWKKGAMLAVGIFIAREPLAILNAETIAEYSAIALRTIQMLVFFVFLGLVAFDLRTFKSATGRNIDWRTFPMITGLSVVEAAASIALAGAGVALSTAFTGQLTNVLGQVASEVIPAPTQPPISIDR